MCAYCKHVFTPKRSSAQTSDISKLRGESINVGAKKIKNNDKLVVLKCSSCGAEIMVDTTDEYSARCHWCRNILSINEQIDNGSVPDVILPFKVEKGEAEQLIKEFVGKRRFFASTRFKKEFTTENIMGVYFPYMLVDVNAHATFIGIGEEETNRYTVGSGTKKETHYDADAYYLHREFDIEIDDLTVESSADRLNISREEKTNNVINAILPFDTENCVDWNANYIKGFSVENRDMDVDDLRRLATLQTEDVARHSANDTLQKYNRGVHWQRQDVNVRGVNWMSAYLPVWLYSYYDKKKALLHYVAANARTKETMGSIPLNKGLLFIVSAIIEMVAVVIAALLIVPSLLTGDVDSSAIYPCVLLIAGPVFYWLTEYRYHNYNARHYHERETKYKVSNMKAKDSFFEKRYNLAGKKMSSANNDSVSGSLQEVKK